MSILGIVLWQPHLGGRTASFARTEGDLSSHPFDEVAADGEPEAETPGGALAPVEALEEVGEVFGIYTASFVLHDKGPAVHPQLNVIAALGVLHSVAQEGQEDLLQLLGIGTNPGVAAYPHAERYLCALRQRLDPESAALRATDSGSTLCRFGSRLAAPILARRKRVSESRCIRLPSERMCSIKRRLASESSSPPVSSSSAAPMMVVMGVFSS